MAPLRRPFPALQIVAPSSLPPGGRIRAVRASHERASERSSRPPPPVDQLLTYEGFRGRIKITLVLPSLRKAVQKKEKEKDGRSKEISGGA